MQNEKKKISDEIEKTSETNLSFTKFLEDKVPYQIYQKLLATKSKLPSTGTL